MKSHNNFIQLPLPGLKVTTSTRIKRALRRAIRSTWFDVACALLAVLVALWWFS